MWECNWECNRKLRYQMACKTPKITQTKLMINIKAKKKKKASHVVMKGITRAHYNKPKHKHCASSTGRLGRMPTKRRARQLKESLSKRKRKKNKKEGRDVKNQAFPEQPMRTRGVALRHTRAITGEKDEKK